MPSTPSRILSRRQFLTFSGFAFLTLLFVPNLGLAASIPQPDRFLNLYNAHTGERFYGPYWHQGSYIKESLNQINHLMRDQRNNQQISIDPQLLDLMHQIQRRLGLTKPLDIVCGYRSPETNKYLRQISTGVAKKSLHMAGKAVDLRVKGVNLSSLRDAAKSLKKGGVGYYPRSNFIHIDVRPTPTFW